MSVQDHAAGKVMSLMNGIWDKRQDNTVNRGDIKMTHRYSCRYVYPVDNLVHEQTSHDCTVYARGFQ